MANRVRYEVLPTSRRDRDREFAARMEAAKVGALVDYPTDPWKVTRNGEAIGTFPRKFGAGGAVEFAVTVARCAWRTQGTLSTLKIKGRHGRIIDERTYGADPHPPKG